MGSQVAVGQTEGTLKLTQQLSRLKQVDSECSVHEQSTGCDSDWK